MTANRGDRRTVEERHGAREAIRSRRLHGRYQADPEDGGSVVTFPALPDLATQGETLEEARSTAEDCLRGYLDALGATRSPRYLAVSSIQDLSAKIAKHGSSVNDV
jgi:predicted RNase H-like HicB family nuclease